MSVQRGKNISGKVFEKSSTCNDLKIKIEKTNVALKTKTFPTVAGALGPLMKGAQQQ